MMGSKQAQSVEHPLRWPMVSELEVRTPVLPIIKGARLLNGYIEHDPVDKESWIFKRMGIASSPTYSVPSGVLGGNYGYAGFPNQSSPQFLTCAGGYLYANGALVGAVTPGGLTYFESVNSNPQTIFIGTSQGAYLYTPDGGALAPIAGDYPLNPVPGVAYLDGTVYVMDTSGNIWGTAGLNNAAVWSSLNVIEASSNADGGIFLAKQLTYIVAFKQYTTQLFYDAANATGSPLGIIPDAQIPYGCFNAYTVQKLDEILFWVSSNQAINPQVIQMENLSPKIISTPAVDRILNLITLANQDLVGYHIVITPNSLYSWSFKRSGHRFYGLTSTTLNITLVYDVDQKFWSIWTDQNGNYWPMTNFAYMPAGSGTPGTLLGQYIGSNPASGSITTALAGNVFKVDDHNIIPTDFGNVFPVDVYTPNASFGTIRRKVLNMMYFSADQTPGSKLQARYTDNDYVSWTNMRTIDLNHERPYLDQEGTFTKRAYHFRHKCATAFRIKASDLQLDIGVL